MKQNKEGATASNANLLVAVVEGLGGVGFLLTSVELALRGENGAAAGAFLAGLLFTGVGIKDAHRSRT
jgi:hypothetical protein